MKNNSKKEKYEVKVQTSSFDIPSQPRSAFSSSSSSTSKCDKKTEYSSHNTHSYARITDIIQKKTPSSNPNVNYTCSYCSSSYLGKESIIDTYNNSLFLQRKKKKKKKNFTKMNRSIGQGGSYKCKYFFEKVKDIGWNIWNYIYNQKFLSNNLEKEYQLKVYQNLIWIGLFLSKMIDMIYINGSLTSILTKSIFENRKMKGAGLMFGFFHMMNGIYILIDVFGLLVIEVIVIKYYFTNLNGIKIVALVKLLYMTCACLSFAVEKTVLGFDDSLAASIVGIIVVLGFIYQPTLGQLFPYLNMFLVFFSGTLFIILYFILQWEINMILVVFFQYYFKVIFINLYTFFNEKSKRNLYVIQNQNKVKSESIKEKQKLTKSVLNDLLPKRYTKRLKKYLCGQKLGNQKSYDIIWLDYWDECINIQIDIVNFSTMCQKYPDKTILGLLNYFFSNIQNLVDMYQFFVVKSEGDSLIFLKTIKDKKNSKRYCKAGIKLCKKIQRFCSDPYKDIDYYIRIGMSIDWCFIYLIGNQTTTVTFDYFGVNSIKASMLEQNSKPNKVHVCNTIVQNCEDNYNFVENKDWLIQLGPLLKIQFSSSYLDNSIRSDVSSCSLTTLESLDDLSDEDTNNNTIIKEKLMKRIKKRIKLFAKTYPEFVKYCISDFKEVLYMFDLECKISFGFIFVFTCIGLSLLVVGLFLENSKYFSLDFIVIWSILSFFSVFYLLFGILLIILGDNNKLYFSKKRAVVKIILKIGYVISCSAVLITFLYFSMEFKTLYSDFSLLFIIINTYETFLFFVISIIPIVICFVIVLPWEKYDNDNFFSMFFNAITLKFTFTSVFFITYHIKERNFMIMHCELKKLMLKNIEIINQQNKNMMLINSVLPKFVTKIFLKHYKKREIFSYHIKNGNICFIELSHFFDKFLQKKSANSVRKFMESYAHAIFTLDEFGKDHIIDKIKLSGLNYISFNIVDENEENNSAYLNMLDYVLSVQSVFEKESIDIKIGVCNGSFFTAIIGTKSFRFDCFGGSINLSSRLCSSSVLNRIHVSENFYEKIKSEVTVEKNINVLLKGFRKQSTFYILTKV